MHTLLFASRVGRDKRSAATTYATNLFCYRLDEPAISRSMRSIMPTESEMMFNYYHLSSFGRTKDFLSIQADAEAGLAWH